MVRAMQNVPVLGDIAEALAPKRDYVSWSFDAARDVINKPRTAKDKAKIGLAAMRRVMQSMEEDARKYAPRKYGYDPSNASLESLYSSLSDRAGRLGYEMQPSPYGTGMDLVRQFEVLSEKIGKDAALDVLLYGGAGVGGAYLANR